MQKILVLLLTATLLTTGCTTTAPAPAPAPAPAAPTPTQATAPSSPAARPKPQPAAATVATGIPGADGIAFGPDGTLYVGSRSTNLVYRIAPDAKVSEWVQVDGAEVLCMTTDPAGNLYVAARDRLVRIAPDKTATVLAEGMNGADDLRLDKAGNIYLTESFTGKVHRITPDGARTVVADLGRPVRGQTWYITGIAFSPDYKFLYIAAMQDNQVLRYPVNADGTLGQATVLAKGLNQPDHMVADTEGNLYLTLYGSGELVKITPDGQTTSLNNSFGRPTGIAFGKGPGFDPRSVYIADLGAGKVVRVPVDATEAP